MNTKSDKQEEKNKKTGSSLSEEELNMVAGGGMRRIDNPFITSMKSENNNIPDLITPTARLQ